MIIITINFSTHKNLKIPIYPSKSKIIKLTLNKKFSTDFSYMAKDKKVALEPSMPLLKALTTCS